jgi:MFS family permease
MTPAVRKRGLIACIAATVTVTATMGLTLPLLGIWLERQGVPVWLNGLSAAVQMMAILFLVPFAPAMIKRFGVVRVITLGIIGMVASLAMIPVFPNVWIWFPLRFVLGFCTEMVFTAGDVWLNQLAEDKKRGMTLALAGVFQHAGFAIGPLLIGFLGADDWTVLYIGIATVSFGLLPLSLGRHAVVPTEGEHRARIFYFIKVAPILMVAALMFGLIDESVLALLIVYGLRKGLDELAAGVLLTSFLVGSVLGQFPLGWLSDRIERTKVIAGCVAVTLLMLIALPYVVYDPILSMTALGLMGATVGSTYMVALAAMGERFRGGELVGITTSFMFLWALGSFVAPALSGTAMELVGPDGMPMLAAVLSVCFLALLLREILRPGRSGAPQAAAGDGSA